MEWLTGILRAALSLLRIVNRILTSVPFIDDLEARIRGKWFSPIVVRRVRRPNDPDLQAALSLYEKRLDSDLRFQSADIIRWVGDDARNRSSKESVAPRDYFVVAKYRHKVLGFILFHYFPVRKIAFIAYMVVEKDTRGVGLNDLSNALTAKVASLLSRDRLLRSCQTLLFEVEDPRKAPRSRQLHDIARVQRFCTLAASQKFSLRAFEINYLQPALAVPRNCEANEEPLLLLSARTGKEIGSTNPQDEVSKMLNFVYLELYPGGFSDLAEEQEKYEAYCRDLHDRVIANLPSKIPVINPAHITCEREVRRASRRRAREVSLVPM